MATTKIDIIATPSSGMLANLLPPDQEISYFQISGLLGLPDSVTQSPTTSDVPTGAGYGSPSWQLEFPCITPYNAGNNPNSWDLPRSEEYNVPLFSHGKFSAGIKPSGEGFRRTVTVGGLGSAWNGTYVQEGLFNGRPYWRYNHFSLDKYLWNGGEGGFGGRYWMFSAQLGNYSNKAGRTALDSNYPWDAQAGSWTEPVASPTFSDYSFTYKLKGDSYVRIPNQFGGVDTYHTSGVGNGNTWQPGRRLTFRYTTPSGGMVRTYGASVALSNGTSRNMYYGNLAIMMGNGGGYKGTTFARSPRDGGGYLGPPGLPPGETTAAGIAAKTGFSAGPSNGLWKNGAQMTHLEETGAMVLSLDPYTVNADADDAGAAGTPSDQVGLVFTTGGLNGPGGGWVQFSGSIGRRDSDWKNTYVSENKCMVSFFRLGEDATNNRDNVTAADYPNASNPVRLMWGYGDPVASTLWTMGQCMCPHGGTISGTANADNTYIAETPDGWGTGSRLDFGNSGHSGDLLFSSDVDGDWQIINNTTQACGDPHITPLFGGKYDL